MDLLGGFFDGFLELGGSILGAFWEPFCMEKPPRNEKGDFVKMRVSCKRELNFGGSSVAEALPKASQKRSKNQCIFSSKK